MSLLNLKSPFPPQTFDPMKISEQMQTDPNVRATFANFFGDPASRHFIRDSGNVLDALARPDNPWSPGAPLMPANGQGGAALSTSANPDASPQDTSYVPAAPANDPTQVSVPPQVGPPFAPNSFSSQGVEIPGRTVGPMDNVHGARKALMLAFLGLNKFGAGLAHQQDSYADQFLGNEMKTEEAQREYDANAPLLRQQAINAQYARNLGYRAQEAGIAHTTQETENLKANLPLQENAAKEYQDLLGHWQNRDVPDFPAYAKARLAGMPPAIAQIVQSKLANIYQIPQTGKGYTVNMQDDLPTSINVYGKNYDPKDPELAKLPVGDAAIADFNRAVAAHGTKRGEKVQDESTVAGFAAAAQARAFAQQKEMEQQKNLDAIKKEGNEADQSYQSIVSLSKQDTGAADNAIIDQFFNLAKPTSGARMNEAQMLRLQNFGSLETRARQWANNVSQGSRLLPEQRTELINAAKVLRDVKVEAVGNNLFVLGGQGGAQPNATASSQQKIATKQHIADYAKSKGISVDVATQEFTNSGYTVK